MTSSTELKELRERIADVDAEILDAVARRMGFSAEIGRIKAAKGMHVEAKEIEERVLKRARARGKELGIQEDLVEDLYRVLLEHSKREQKRRRRDD